MYRRSQEFLRTRVYNLWLKSKSWLYACSSKSFFQHRIPISIETSFETPRAFRIDLWIVTGRWWWCLNIFCLFRLADSNCNRCSIINILFGTHSFFFFRVIGFWKLVWNVAKKKKKKSSNELIFVFQKKWKPCKSCKFDRTIIKWMMPYVRNDG